MIGLYASGIFVGSPGSPPVGTLEVSGAPGLEAGTPPAEGAETEILLPDLIPVEGIEEVPPFI
jgi:hypothetical protein